MLTGAFRVNLKTIWGNKMRNCMIIIAVAALIPLQAIAEQPVTVSKLLDEYGATQDKLLPACAIKYEVFVENTSKYGKHKPKTSKTWEIQTMVYDENRASRSRYVWGDDVNEKAISRETAGYNRTIWDGNTNYNYSRGHDTLGRVTINNTKTAKKYKDNPKTLNYAP